MGNAFLIASTGLLMGMLGVTVPPTVVQWVVLVGLVIGLVFSPLISWQRTSVLALMMGALFVGHNVAQTHDREWQALPETVYVETSYTVIKRESAKVWYQPVVLRPLAPSEVTSAVLWRAPRTVSFQPGDQLILGCELKRPENFDPRFDYARYLATRDIGYMCTRAVYVRQLETVDRVRQIRFLVQEAVRTHINRVVAEPGAGLLQGLFLGGDDALSPALTEHFRRAGLSHIVAVSGYNMTLVAFAVLVLALSLGFWRKTATVLAVIGIGLFLAIIDTSAASIRAALMAWVVCLAFFIGRPGSALHGLLLAAALMAIENPGIVRYDVGFQLSCVATLALLVVSPWLEILIKPKGLIRRGLALLLATCAIEISIAPIIIFHFGLMSWFGPIANLVALPLIPFIMALGCVVLFVGWLIPLAIPLLSLPLWWLLMLIIWTAEIIGGLTWSATTDMYLSRESIISWYLVLSALVWYSRNLLSRYALRMDH